LVPQAGHSIGRDVHEPPFLTPDDYTVLEPNMIIDVEIAMRVKGIGSINVEDEVLITEEGSETITTLTRELIRI
jgi:Xaa-Pro aminopeptidase